MPSRSVCSHTSSFLSSKLLEGRGCLPAFSLSPITKIDYVPLGVRHWAGRRGCTVASKLDRTPALVGFQFNEMIFDIAVGMSGTTPA